MNFFSTFIPKKNPPPRLKKALVPPSVRGSSHSEKQTLLFRQKPRIKKNFFLLETFFLFTVFVNSISPPLKKK